MLINGLMSLHGTPSHVRRLSTKGTSLMDAVQEVRTRLDSQESSWDDLWKDGMTPWDLGKPTPLLIQELHKMRVNTQKTSRLRSLVPGCGSGYDLLTLVDHHDGVILPPPQTEEELIVVGLDVSPQALKSAERIISGKESSSTRVALACGDFFEDTSKWETVFCSSSSKTSSLSCPTKFDFIFDYTFFVALPPELRPKWGERTAQLLDPQHGRLLTIMFPILPDADRTQGPPYPISIQDYVDVLEPHGIVMDGEAFESPLSVSSRAGKEMVCYWKVAQQEEEEGHRHDGQQRSFL